MTMHQGTELDLSIHQLTQSQNYNEYTTSLSKALHLCTTQEEVKKVSIVMKKQKRFLMLSNPEFKSIIERQMLKAKMKVQQSIAAHNAKIKDVKTMIKTAKTKSANTKAQAQTAKRNAMELLNKQTEEDLEKWVSQTRIKVRTKEEAEADLSDKLGCPNPKCIEHGKNRNNVLNGIPTCMRCWHKLVLQSEFKDYNRAYWRRFNKKKR